MMTYLNEYKNKYYNLIIYININFLLIILLLQMINSIIEIPIEIITINNYFNNNNNINNYNKASKQLNSSNIYPKIFMEEGITKINNQHLFIATIKIGSNSQIFRLILDTGSSLTWVSDIQSQTDGSSEISKKFDPDSSSTCIKLYKTFNIQYGTGSCSGFYYIDTFKFIANKEFKLKFGVAKNAKFDFSEADGIIGLSRTNSDINSSFISMLYESKIINSKLFSFKFALNNLDIPMGKLFIGKHEDFSKSNSFSCDLLNNNYENLYYWTCELQYFGLENNGYIISTNHSIPIIFDTGTNFIFLPYEYLQEMENDIIKVGCKISIYEEEKKDLDFNNQEIHYRLICPANKLPQFHFVLGDTKFTLPSSLTFYLNRGLAYSYILFILNNKEYNPYIFGSSFFMSFHTLFNNEENKLQFYPLDSKYIIKDKSFNIINIIVILQLILLWVILFYMIYHFYKWKKQQKLEEYQNIIHNDINIEMNNK